MPNPIRVLLVSHTCQSRDEGQPKAVELGRFDDINLRVIVPSRWRHYGRQRSAEPKLQGRFDYQPTPIRWPWLGPAQWYLHYYPSMARLLKEFRPDVIDLWEEPYGLVSAHTIRLRNRLMPSAKVITETEQNINKQLPPPFEQFRKYTLRHADFAVGRNAEAISILQSKGFAGPAEVVPNAVDVSRFVPMPKAACRASWNITEGFVVGYVGRLVEEKGIDEILQALRALPASVRLVIAGEGPMRDRIASFAAEPAIAGRVQLLGQVPAARLAELMNAIDVLLVPSRTTPSWKEQFGRVIIEAHACGTPVIGSSSGAIPDVVGQGGVIVPERDAGRLCAAIIALQASPSLLAQTGELGRCRAIREFTWTAVAGRMREIYRKLISGTGSTEFVRRTALQ